MYKHSAAPDNRALTSAIEKYQVPGHSEGSIHYLRDIAKGYLIDLEIFGKRLLSVEIKLLKYYEKIRRTGFYSPTLVAC